MISSRNKNNEIIHGVVENAYVPSSVGRLPIKILSGFSGFTADCTNGKIGLHYFPWFVCTTSCQLSTEKARKSSLPRQLRFKGYHPRMLHYSNMLRGPSIKVDMFGVMWFVQIPRSLLQIIGDGKRQIVGFINHSGPPLKRHPRHATN